MKKKHLANTLSPTHNIPSKEWLNITEVVKETNSSHQTISPIYKSLQIAWKKANKKGEETFTVENITIPTDQAGFFRMGKNSKKDRFYLHKSIVHLLAEPRKTKEWLNISEMIKKTRKSHKTIAPIYRSLQVSWKEAIKNGKKTITAGNITVPLNKASFFQDKYKKTFCLHQEIASLFIKPQKTKKWLNIGEMTRAIRTSTKKISAIYKLAQIAWKKATEQGKGRFTVNNITIPTDKAGFFCSGNVDIFCLHQDIIPLFANPRKTKQWLTATDMKHRAKSSYEAVIPVYKAVQAAWAIAKKQEKENVTVNNITIPTDKAGFFQAKGQVFCLHQDLIPLFKKFPKTKEWLGIVDITKKLKVGYLTIAPVYKLLRREWEKAKNSGLKVVTIEDLSISVDKLAVLDNMQAFCLHESLLDIIKSSGRRGKKKISPLLLRAAARAK